MDISREEIEREFRAAVKQKSCLSCGTSLTDAAIDWGYAQPSDYEKDGPFPLKCERCAAIQHYDLFTRSLTLLLENGEVL